MDRWTNLPPPAKVADAAAGKLICIRPVALVIDPRSQRHHGGIEVGGHQGDMGVPEFGMATLRTGIPPALTNRPLCTLWTSNALAGPLHRQDPAPFNPG